MKKRTQVDVGIVVWASFLAACTATMVFFAFIDPLHLGAPDAPPIWARDRLTGYTIGFFFFWAACALASAFTAFLVETRRSDELEDSADATRAPNGSTPTSGRESS
jgi:hypothetical protein